MQLSYIEGNGFTYFRIPFGSGSQEDSARSFFIPLDNRRQNPRGFFVACDAVNEFNYLETLYVANGGISVHSKMAWSHKNGPLSRLLNPFGETSGSPDPIMDGETSGPSDGDTSDVPDSTREVIEIKPSFKASSAEYHCFIKGRGFSEHDFMFYGASCAMNIERIPFINKPQLQMSRGTSLDDLLLTFYGGENFFYSMSTQFKGLGSINTATDCTLKAKIGDGLQPIHGEFSKLAISRQSFSLLPKDPLTPKFNDTNQRYELSCPSFFDKSYGNDFRPLLQHYDIFTKSPSIELSPTRGERVIFLATKNLDLYAIDTQPCPESDQTLCLDRHRYISCDRDEPSCRCSFPITMSQCKAKYDSCDTSFTESCNCDTFPMLPTCRQRTCTDSQNPDDCCPFSGLSQQCEAKCRTNYKGSCCKHFRRERECLDFEQECENTNSTAPQCSCEIFPNRKNCREKRCLLDANETDCCNESLDPNYCVYYHCTKLDTLGSAECEAPEVKCLGMNSVECAAYLFCKEHPEHGECTEAVTAGVKAVVSSAIISALSIGLALVMNFV